MRHELPGKPVTLAELRGRLTGRTKYVRQFTSEP
jgi:hypothetical protein